MGSVVQINWTNNSVTSSSCFNFTYYSPFYVCIYIYSLNWVCKHLFGIFIKLGIIIEHPLTILPLNVCFQTFVPLNSSSSDNFDEKIVNNCISNLYIPAKLVTSILQLSQTKFISSLVQENIFGVLTSSKISLRSLGVKWLRCIIFFNFFIKMIDPCCLNLHYKYEVSIFYRRKFLNGSVPVYKNIV